MPRSLMFAVGTALVIALGAASCTVIMPWRRALAFKRFETPVPVSLAGLATIDLEPSFKVVGRGGGRSRTGPDFDIGTLDQHRNDDLISFRFEQGQHKNMGAYDQDPVLLSVTLYNPDVPARDITTITGTFIQQFYPPVDNDEPRLAAHFAAQRWLPDHTSGAAITRIAAANEGRGDDLVSGPPERWLVIHVDPVRHLRVDFYAWRKAYTLEEARALVQRVSESLKTSPRLVPFFADVKRALEREAAEHARTVSVATTALRACGIDALGPGKIAWGQRCVASLSEDSEFLHAARPVGRVPLSAVTRRRDGSATLPADSSSISAMLPRVQLTMLYWDDASSKWRLEGVGEELQFGDLRESPLLAAITARLTDRASVYLLSMAREYFGYGDDRLDVAAYLREADRVAAAVRGGTVIPGVTVSPFDFPR